MTVKNKPKDVYKFYNSRRPKTRGEYIRAMIELRDAFEKSDKKKYRKKID